MKMKRFASRLRISVHETPPDVICGKNFNIFFEDPPPSPFELITKMKHEPTPEDIPSREIIIEAKDFLRAQNILHLILAAESLLSGIPLHTDPNFLIVSSIDNPAENLNFQRYFGLPGLPTNGPLQTFGLITACQLAARVSFRKYLITALMKFFVSTTLHVVSPIDLDPNHSPHISLSPFPFDHIRYGYALFIAYTVLEELDLTVKASQDQPSKIKGKWNPIIKCDLEMRLINAHIDILEPVDWIIRGTPRKNDKLYRFESAEKTPWAFGTSVRDISIPIIDAINYLSRTRSNLLAHKSGQRLKSLSVYDVANAQHLVRRLLLETLGFWKNI